MCGKGWIVLVLVFLGGVAQDLAGGGGLGLGGVEVGMGAWGKVWGGVGWCVTQMGSGWAVDGVARPWDGLTGRA